MKWKTCALSLAAATLFIQGCGWKMVKNPIRVQGQVVEVGTGEPVEGAYIDIADEREKLDFRITTECATDSDGKFEGVYDYIYDRWMWLGLPVFWLPSTPERLYLEVVKNGYRPRVTEIEYRGRHREGTVLTLDPIRINRKAPGRSRVEP